MTHLLLKSSHFFFSDPFRAGYVANVSLNKTKSNDWAGWLITHAWGLAVYVEWRLLRPYSGAHLNPAVSIRPGVAIN